MITDLTDAIQEVKRVAGGDGGDSLSVDLSEQVTDHGTTVPIDAAIAIITDVLLGEGYLPGGSVEIPGGRRIHYIKDDDLE
jgi:hypothetical protein